MADVAPTWREELLQDWHRYSPAEPTFKRVLGALIMNAGFLAVFLFRLCQRFRQADRILLAAMVKRVNLALTAAELNPAAYVAPGLYLPHPYGVGIGGGCRLGSRVTLHQGVSLGAKTVDVSGEARLVEYPRVGNNVILYPHVLVYGPVHLCDGVVVLGNSVVSRDLDRPGVYAGLPATLVSEKPTHPIETLQRDARS